MYGAKDYFSKRIDELNKNMGQSTYTRATLLALASACLSPPDSILVDTYLDVHFQDQDMKELAETEIRTKMLDLHKQMNTRPVDAFSGPTAGSKQHNLLFNLAKQGKPLPKTLFVNFWQTLYTLHFLVCPANHFWSTFG